MIDFLHMVRKIFGVLIGILGYLALITGASVITIAVIDSAARPEKWDGNVFLILAMASAVLIGLSMTKAGQDIFESTEGQFEKDRGPGRWFYRGIFISFAAVFFCAIKNPATDVTGFSLQQVTGIEPAHSAWEADVLPLYDTCIYVIRKKSL